MPNSNETKNKPKRALVLSGGGGRGAYHVGALRFLEEQEWQPDIVVGTSIGAVNGAALASGHNAHSLKALWKQLKTRNVQKVNLNLFKSTSILDTEPLRQTLLEDGWLDFDRINAPEPILDLRITATEISSGQLHVFGNSDNVRKSALQRVPITIDHIVSSCSIPLVYPATTLEDRQFWDGAILANTPLGAAIDAGATEIVVVIMTPYRADESMLAAIPRDLLTAVTMMLDWVLLSSFKAELRTFQSINKQLELMERLSAYEDPGNDETNKVRVADPIIISPDSFLSLGQIISYREEEHEILFDGGYRDAQRAWREHRRPIEGESES